MLKSVLSYFVRRKMVYWAIRFVQAERTWDEISSTLNALTFCDEYYAAARAFNKAEEGVDRWKGFARRLGI